MESQQLSQVLKVAELPHQSLDFAKDGERLVGQTAKRQAVTNPENTVFSIKRFMGRMFNEVDNEISEVPYKVDKNSNGACVVKANDKEYTPPEISAMVLQKLKQQAEEYLGTKGNGCSNNCACIF